MGTMANKQLSILVTGGAGFIGSHLCRTLVQQGHRVYCVDSFFSGTKHNIADLLDNPLFSLIVHDIRRPLSFSKPLDRIYNLACPASPTQYQFDPVLTLETNVIGIQHMLGLARRTGARLLQTSTSEVYGDPLEHPQKETYWGNVDPLGKRSCYDEGKRAAESLCKDYFEQYGVETRIVRIFNTYGPGMMFNDGRVLSNFILQALSGEDITVHGDGSQTRSFCYIDDLVNGLVLAMERKNGDWFPINLGNPDERTIRDVAERVVAGTDTKSTLVNIPIAQIPDRIGDPKQRCPDISRAKTLLDWAPTVSFADGLKKTIDDFRSRLGHKSRVLVFVDALSNDQKSSFVNTLYALRQWQFVVVTTDRSFVCDAPHVAVVFARSVIGGARVARAMHRKHPFRTAWVLSSRSAIMMSVLFRLFRRRVVPFLFTVMNTQVSSKDIAVGAKKSWKYQWLFGDTHRWQIIGDVAMQDKAALELERHVQVIDGEDISLRAKRTKELFSELEILSTRL